MDTSFLSLNNFLLFIYNKCKMFLFLFSENQPNQDVAANYTIGFDK